MHAAVVRSTFRSQSVKSRPRSDHCWTFNRTTRHDTRQDDTTTATTTTTRTIRSTRSSATTATTTATATATTTTTTTLRYTTPTQHYTRPHCTALHYTTLHSIALRYTTLRYATLHYTIQLHNTTATKTTTTTTTTTATATAAIQRQLQYATPRYIQQLWVRWPLQPIQKDNSNHFSVLQWVRSAIHASQQLASPIVSFLWNFRHRLVRYYW